MFAKQMFELNIDKHMFAGYNIEKETNVRKVCSGEESLIFYNDYFITLPRIKFII
jgi:hypothetical protein